MTFNVDLSVHISPPLHTKVNQCATHVYVVLYPPMYLLFLTKLSTKQVKSICEGDQ
jgi:hypothetical protein